MYIKKKYNKNTELKLVPQVQVIFQCDRGRFHVILKKEILKIMFHNDIVFHYCQGINEQRSIF